jgi:transposase-like protein
MKGKEKKWRCPSCGSEETEEIYHGRAVIAIECCRCQSHWIEETEEDVAYEPFEEMRRENELERKMDRDISGRRLSPG